MKNLLSILFLTLFLFSCADDRDCSTCTSETTGGTVTVKYCQDGNDVESNTGGVLSTIPNTTVEAVVATQVGIGVNCN